jgi:hypothetical protein
LRLFGERSHSHQRSQIILSTRPSPAAYPLGDLGTMERSAGGRQRCSRHGGGFDDASGDTGIADSSRSCCSFHDTIRAEVAAEVRYTAKVR